MDEKKYISKIVNGGVDLYLKDAEARASIETINDTISDLTSGLTGAMHYIGSTTSAVADGSTINPVVIDGDNVTAVAGDVIIAGEVELVWSGSKWQELGSTGSIKALAFKDNASASYQPAGSNSSSAVTFTGGTDADFVTGFNTDAVAPSFTEGAFTQGTLPSFTEGAFTPASLSAGFVTAGTAATYSHTGFSGGSLGSATTSSFATEGQVATYNEGSEALTLTAASTSNAVTAQGAFTPAVYGTDTFDGGTPTVVDTTKFNGGSKASDTFDAGTLPSKAADTFNAGSAATPTTAKAITSIGTGTAAAQTFTGTSTTITVA